VSALYDRDMPELLRRLHQLEHENNHLRAVIADAVCGDLLDHESSCQLTRNHKSLHAWLSPDGTKLFRW
jgi:hypothetical protein